MVYHKIYQSLSIETKKLFLSRIATGASKKLHNTRRFELRSSGQCRQPYTLCVNTVYNEDFMEGVMQHNIMAP